MFIDFKFAYILDASSSHITLFHFKLTLISLLGLIFLMSAVIWINDPFRMNNKWSCASREYTDIKIQFIQKVEEQQNQFIIPPWRLSIKIDFARRITNIENIFSLIRACVCVSMIKHMPFIHQIKWLKVSIWNKYGEKQSNEFYIAFNRSTVSNLITYSSCEALYSGINVIIKLHSS